MHGVDKEVTAMKTAIKLTLIFTVVVGAFLIIPLPSEVYKYAWDLYHGETISRNGLTLTLADGVYVEPRKNHSDKLFLGVRGDEVGGVFAEGNLISLYEANRADALDIITASSMICGDNCRILYKGKLVSDNSVVFTGISYKKVIPALDSDYHAYFFNEKTGVAVELHGDEYGVGKFMTLIRSAKKRAEKPGQRLRNLDESS